jgi:hypothetical protein
MLMNTLLAPTVARAGMVTFAELVPSRRDTLTALVATDVRAREQFALAGVTTGDGLHATDLTLLAKAAVGNSGPDRVVVVPLRVAAIEAVTALVKREKRLLAPVEIVTEAGMVIFAELAPRLRATLTALVAVDCRATEHFALAGVNSGDGCMRAT